MPHAQQQVLDAIAASLVAAGTDAAARVFVDRVDPLQPQELPAVLVDEAPDGETTSADDFGPTYTRNLSVRVVCVVAQGSTAGARELGLQVEKAMATGAALAAVAKGGVVLQNSRPQTDTQADRLLSLREQEWQLTYFTNAATPDVLV
jgi:hypothetical protein